MHLMQIYIKKKTSKRKVVFLQELFLVIGKKKRERKKERKKDRKMSSYLNTYKI